MWEKIFRSIGRRKARELDGDKPPSRQRASRREYQRQYRKKKADKEKA